MDEKLVEIAGQTFDLNDPEGKRAAIRAWLAAKSEERETKTSPEVSPEKDGPGFNKPYS